jgi:hypothetical protein
MAEAQTPPRRPARNALPLPPPPAPPLPAGPRAEAAPLPNRDLEAPPERFTQRERTRVEPTIISPRALQRGQTFGAEHLPDRNDRLFQEPAPGARLRIPLN